MGGQGPIQYDWRPYEKGEFGHGDTLAGRMPCEDERRGQGDVAEAKGCQRLAADHQELGCGSEEALTALGRNSPADTLISDFQPPKP